MASTTETKNVNWANFAAIAAGTDVRIKTVKDGGELPDEVHTKHAVDIRKAARALQETILNAAKASKRANLSFLTAAMVSVQTGKNQAIDALLCPYAIPGEKKKTTTETSECPSCGKQVEGFDVNYNWKHEGCKKPTSTLDTPRSSMSD
jgi:hypothetical protein